MFAEIGCGTCHITSPTGPNTRATGIHVRLFRRKKKAFFKAYQKFMGFTRTSLSSRRPTVDKVLGHTELKQEGEEGRTWRRRRQHQRCLSSEPSHHARGGIICCVISCSAAQLLEWMPQRTTRERDLTQSCRFFVASACAHRMYITGSRRVLPIFRNTMAGRDCMSLPPIHQVSNT